MSLKLLWVKKQYRLYIRKSLPMIGRPVNIYWPFFKNYVRIRAPYGTFIFDHHKVAKYIHECMHAYKHKRLFICKYVCNYKMCGIRSGSISYSKHDFSRHTSYFFLLILFVFWVWVASSDHKLTCKHAVMCQNRTRIGPMLLTSVQYRPCSDTLRYVLPSKACSRFCTTMAWPWHVNSSPPEQNGRHFADDIFKCIFVTGKFVSWFKLHWSFASKGPIDNKSVLVQVIAWRRGGDKLLSETMLTQLIDAHMRQWGGGGGLTHWGRVTHICVSKLTIIGSDNGLSPGRRQCWAIVN